MSLSEKVRHIECEASVSLIKGSWFCANCKSYINENDVVVRFDYAQQEIDHLIEQRNIESGIVDRMQREREEQKQKLKQTCDDIRSKLKFLDYEQYHGDLKQSFNPTLREINKLITELLK